MDVWLALWRFAIPLGANALGETLGMASGIFIVPILTILGRVDIRTAIGASLVSVSAGAYLMRGEIVSAIAGPVALGSVVGAVAGARILVRIPNEKVRVLFAVVLVGLGAQMLLRALGIRLGEAVR